MFLRILIWVVLLVGGWWVVRKKLGRPPAGTPPRTGSPTPAPGALAQAEPMVDCAHCGLHFPASEASRDAEARAYCCAEHRLAGPRATR